jgi:hypothetical protein
MFFQVFDILPFDSADAKRSCESSVAESHFHIAIHQILTIDGYFLHLHRTIFLEATAVA